MFSSVVVRIFVSLLLCFSLQSCGFKLKQPASLDNSLSSISIIHQRASPSFINILEKNLKAAGVRINPLAATELNIISYQEQRQAASIDTNNARQTETRITKTLKYSVSTKQGELIIPPNTLSQSKEYINNNNNISGKAEEERILQKAIDKEIVALLLRRLEKIENKDLINVNKAISTQTDLTTDSNPSAHQTIAK